MREGELAFDFSGCVGVERLDRDDRPIPQGMALVDFVVEEQDRLLLVEVKDPSQAPVPAGERAAFLRRMQTRELVHMDLVPKVRDSYTFLHLMGRDTKPFSYVVIIGAEALALDGALLLAFKERLQKRLQCETDVPWVRRYVVECVVVTASNWDAYFPYPLRRQPG